MAPKTSKRAKTGEGSSEAFDRYRFRDEEASKLYSELVIKRNVIPERGLLPCIGEQPSIYHNISERGWEEFTKQPKSAVVPLVREFYANMQEDRTKVFVRGKLVSFDFASINRFYNLPSIDRNGYATYAANEVDYDEIIATLCQPGTQWATRQGEKLNFKAAHLSVMNKVWHNFICAKLLPVTHVSDVTKDRAVLLYAIVTGKSIDVGNIIQQSIKHTKKASTTGGLALPSLITSLCKAGGVIWGSDEELKHPKCVMDKKHILGLKGPTLVEDPAHSQQFLIGTSSQPPPEQSPHDPPEDQLSLEERLERMELRQTQRLDRMEERQEQGRRRMERRMQRHMEHNTQCFDRLFQVLARPGFNQEDDPILCPTPPLSSDEEENM